MFSICFDEPCEVGTCDCSNCSSSPPLALWWELLRLAPLLVTWGFVVKWLQVVFPPDKEGQETTGRGDAGGNAGEPKGEAGSGDAAATQKARDPYQELVLHSCFGNLFSFLSH